jgi:hypothetical protein
MEYQFGSDVPNEIQHHILLKGVAHGLILGIEHIMPILSPNKKALAVCCTLVQELGSHFECDSESADHTLVFVFDWKDFVFVDFKSYLHITLLDEVNLSKLVQLFIDVSPFIKIHGLQLAEHSHHQLSIFSIIPSIKFPSAN